MPPPTTSTRLAGKTAVVTGATQGIGLAAAEAMAAMGARVIITARDQARGAAAKAGIMAKAGHKNVDVVDVDFSSLASIRSGAAAVRTLTDRVDILLNNAGAVFMERGETVDGLERTFATNHLGYFLWTHELLDLVKAAAPSRIVNVSSSAHRAATGGVSFDDLQHQRSYVGFAVYGESKLMNIMFTKELARRLDGTGVTVNALHPGVIASGFGQNNGGIMGFATKRLGKYFLTTPEKGARTSIYLCTAPEVAGTTGRYFADCKPASVSRHAEDATAARRLWTESEVICGQTSAQVAA